MSLPFLAPPTEQELEIYLAMHNDASREYDATVTYPPSGFLRSYVDYASRLTDAPRIFHVVCGLTILATAVGNRLYMRAWGARLALNLWTVLVAASSFYRKTQSIKIATRILTKALPDALYPDSFSMERLQQVLSRRPCGLLVAYEVAELWSLLRRDYNQGGLGFFLRLYDSEDRYVRETLSGGKIEILSPAVSMMAATTPDWLLGDGMKSQDVTAGGLPRFLIVPATQKEREMAYSDFGDLLVEAELAAYVSGATTLSGKLDVDRDASKALDNWMNQVRSNVAKGKLPPELQPFWSRLQVMTLKIAGLCYVSAPTEAPVVTVGHMEQAIGLIKRVTHQTAVLMTEGIAYSREGERAMLVMKRLRDAGGRMSFVDLVHSLRQHMSLRQLEASLDTLKASESVLDVEDRTGKRGRPPRIIALYPPKPENNEAAAS